MLLGSRGEPLKNGCWLIAGTLVFAVFACADPDAELRHEYRVAALALASQFDPGAKQAVEGRGGWILYSREINYLIAGSKLGDVASQTSGSSPPEYSDPVSVIVGFHSQLEQRGVELYVVPVPERPVIYPESILGPGPFANREVIPILHSYLQEVLSVLQERGVRVIDLTEVFLGQREGPDGRTVFSPSETHWTPYGISLAAEVIAAKISQRSLFAAVEKNDFHQQWMLIEHSGNMYQSYEKQTGTSLRPDEVLVRGVRLETDEGSRRIHLKNPQSPVIVLGDSNTIFWNHLDSALPHHLAYELGFPVDVFGSKGGGANESRLNLVRQIRSEPDYLDGKSVVIWCFSARTFTNPQQGWISMALDRQEEGS